MSQDIKEIFDMNFDFKFKAVTYSNIKVALEAFEQFKIQNESFFSFDKREPLFGYLRSYSIEKQFNDSAFNPKANYSVSMKQVNNYGYKALCIDTDNFLVNLGRTNKPTMLLSSSSYKKEFAKANMELNTQLSLEFMENDIIEIVDSKKYAEITYGYRFGVLDHLNIILPNSYYNGIEHSSNLLKDIKVYNKYVPEELVEESIVSLKKALFKKVDKIS